LNLIAQESKEWGLNPGEQFPDLKLKTIEGEDFDLFDPSYDTLMIIFSSPKCIPCQELNQILAEYQRKNTDIKVVLFMKGRKEEIIQAKEEWHLVNIIVTELTDTIMEVTETKHFPLTFLVSTGYNPAGKRKVPELLQKGRIIMKGLAVNEEHLDIVKSVSRLPRAYLDIWY
jgi:hypothetical protein